MEQDSRIEWLTEVFGSTLEVEESRVKACFRDSENYELLKSFLTSEFGEGSTLYFGFRKTDDGDLSNL